MSNIIKIKGKTTTGAPALSDLAVRELCIVLPDNAIYYKKDAGTIVGPFTVAGTSGDMLKSIYDTNNNGKIDTAENAEKLGGAPASDYATQTYVISSINALVNSAPGTLDTLKELADALGDDPNFAATITAALATKLDSNSTIDGGTF
jgi:hypothetical protein